MYFEISNSTLALQLFLCVFHIATKPLVKLLSVPASENDIISDNTTFQ